MDDDGFLVTLLILLVGGAAAWYILNRSNVGSSSINKLPTSGPVPPPGAMYTGNDLGPFTPVLSLPVLGQAYGVLAPVNSKLIQPLVSGIRSDVVDPLNAKFGIGHPKTTVNANGTITRDAGNGWYATHVGKPASQAGTAVVNTVSKVLPWNW